MDRTRRDFLVGVAAVGAAALVTRPADLFAQAAQPRTPVRFSVPPGACDCHIHVFGDPARYPMVATRVYTPPPATVAELNRLHKTLGLDRVVVVQPSVYGTDNRCTLDAIRELGPRARGVGVIDDKTPETALADMARAGIRGVRINLETAGIADPAVARQRLSEALARVKAQNWHIQINTRLSVIEGVKDQVLAALSPIVFDHFGTAEAALGPTQPGFGTLVSLVKSGHAYVKISGSYRSSVKPDYGDMAPLAKALVAANPQRVLWGTDWPHADSIPKPGRKNTDIAPYLQVDDGQLFNLLADWVPDAATRQLILVDNPRRLYGF